MRSQNRVSYKEDDSSDLSQHTSDESDPSSDAIDSSFETQLPSNRTKSVTKKRKRNLPSRNRQMKVQAGTKQDLYEEHPALSLGEKVPPWQELPYHILLEIFYYSYYPLDFFEPQPISRLLGTARLCRSFMEPALSVLYYSPPNTRANPLRLIAHLESQTKDSALNYRAKVKYLQLDPRCSPKNVKKLLALTPQLRGLRLLGLTQRPVWLVSNSVNNVIFQSLQFHHIALQEWEWDSCLTGYKLHAPMVMMHSLKAFQNLRSLTLTNYDGHVREDKIAEAINILPHLKSLSFKSSAIVDQKLLPLLPDQLEYFELESCPNVTSEIINTFLASHGQSIRQLILDNNWSLNLSFLADLAVTCPRVEYMRINLKSYYNKRIDRTPRFESLLHLDKIPSWPRSLQHLELFHLRRWNLAAAEMLFSSLVNSAASLSSLRRLEIKASLEESGWRDRIMFRDRWTSQLKHIFLRVSPPPNPHLRSIGDFERYKCQSGNADKALSNESPKISKLALRTNGISKRVSQFSRIAINPVNDDDQYSDSDVETEDQQVGNRRSKRLKLQVDNHQPTPARNTAPLRHYNRRSKGDDDSSTSEDSAIDDSLEKDSDDESKGSDNKEFQIQGMCDVVNVTMDNLRPSDKDYNESHFLDSEVSGDEDWNGDDNLTSEG